MTRCDKRRARYRRDGLLPGPKLAVESETDYRGYRHQLRMQSVLTPSDRVLLIDDWAQFGSQASAARELVQLASATFVGVALLVDQLADEMRASLVKVTALVTAAELGPPT